MSRVAGERGRCSAIARGAGRTATIPVRLRVWAVVFAAVLSQALEVAAFWDPEAARKLNFEGQGVVVAMMLFLARRAGLPVADVGDLVMEGAVGERPVVAG